MKLKPHRVCGKRPAWQPRPLDRTFAFIPIGAARTATGTSSCAGTASTRRRPVANSTQSSVKAAAWLASFSCSGAGLTWLEDDEIRVGKDGWTLEAKIKNVRRVGDPIRYCVANKCW